MYLKGGPVSLDPTVLAYTALRQSCPSCVRQVKTPPAQGLCPKVDSSLILLRKACTQYKVQ